MQCCKTECTKYINLIIIVETNRQQILNSVYDSVLKPGACGQRPRAPGFLKLLWFTCRYACVSAPEAINNQWRDMM